MSYSVRLYLNSGFNSYNIPLTPGVLDTAGFIDVPAIDTLQGRVLHGINIRATWSQVKNADYCKISDGTDTWYYSVDDITMTSNDVAYVSLTPDYLLSAGGAGSLVYTDGITQRAHCATADDAFGAFCEPDPLTAPAQPLLMDTTYITDPPAHDNVYKSVTLVESTIDIKNTEMGSNALTYTDSITGETVTVPQAADLTTFTEHEYGGKHGTGTFSLTGFITSVVAMGIQKIRSMGMEGAIVASYSVPSGYLSLTDYNDVITGNDVVANLRGRKLSTDCQIPWENGTTRNKRVQYGEYIPYGIITASGDKGEFKAEDIYDSSITAPKVYGVPDLRADGRPYYRFDTFHGIQASAQGNDQDFWKDCLAGAPWAVVPISYDSKSGSMFDRMMFSADQKRSVAEYNTSIGEYAKNLGSSIGEYIAGDALTGAISGGKVGVAGAVLGGAIGTATGAVRSWALQERMYDEAVNRRASFGRKRTAEWTQYLVSQTVAPEIVFPYQYDIIRDAIGNGCIVYRYKYTSTDRARIDKLLSMYGYRQTKALETADFNRRAKFSYVQATGVEVTANAGGRLPKWWSDGIAEQLEGGVRVWKVLPDVAAYTDGSNT